MNNSTSLGLNKIFDSQNNVESQYPLFFVGVLCAIIGNSVISIGMFLQKQVHILNIENESYVKLPQWWFALSVTVIGEIGNFLAYGMSPATVVSPLGGLTVVLNFVWSHLFLQEQSSWYNIGGIVVSLLGGVFIVMFSPVSSTMTVEYIYNCLVSWSSLLYFCMLIIFILYILNPLDVRWAISKKTSRENVIYYCIVCGITAAFTVTSAKGISTAFVMVFNGDSAMFTQSNICWLTYLLFIVIGISVFFQVKYFNEALIFFASTVVVPTFYIFFTTFSVLTAMIVFIEFTFSPLIPNVILFVFGLLLAFAGIYLVSMKQTSKLDILVENEEKEHILDLEP